MKTIRTRYVFEFEADVEGIDPKYVDITGLAKESTIRELESIVRNGDLSIEDIEILETK